MRIQICSDLRITTIKDSNNLASVLKPCADTLLICGNISKPHNILYAKFLRYINANFKKVFIIPGRYELGNSNKNINKIINLLKIKIDKFKNIHLLNEDLYEDEELIVFGTTLWSKISGRNQVLINKKINDFRNINISESSGHLTIAKINDMHNTAVKFITENLDKLKNTKKKKILLTNFIPILPKFISENVDSSENIDFILGDLVGKSHNDRIMDKSELYEYYFTDHTDLCKEFDLCSFGNFDSTLTFKNDKTTFACNPGRENSDFVVNI